MAAVSIAVNRHIRGFRRVPYNVRSSISSLLTELLAPPSPSDSDTRTVLSTLADEDPANLYVNERIKAFTAVLVAELFKFTTKGTEPPVPPVKVPITIPPKRMFEPDTPICPVEFPTWRTTHPASGRASALR